MVGCRWREERGQPCADRGSALEDDDRFPAIAPHGWDGVQQGAVGALHGELPAGRFGGQAR